MVKRALLEDNEYQDIMQARNRLQQLIETADVDSLKQAIRQVEAVSESYVEKRMNASVQKVLAGKNIDQVLANLCLNALPQRCVKL